MATTIQSGYANSPKLTANIADHADVFGGRALVFDGVTDYLQASVGYTLTDATFSLWFNKDTSHTGFLFNLFENTASGWGLRIVNDTVEIYDDSNSSDASVYSTAVSSSVWYHLVVTVGSNEQKLYLNGELKSSGTNIASSLSGIDGDLFIGSRKSDQQYFNGSMCDFKIFDSALTEAQVTELYRKPENTPSAVQDNLIAWYPMIEGNPESPQSIVYDHSEKGLGSEVVSGSDWTPDSGITVSNGSLVFNTSTQFNKAIDTTAVSGKLYKTVFTISNYVSGSTKIRIGAFGEERSGNGTYTEYIVSTTGNVEFYAYTDGSNNFTIENISVKEVRMGNHAATNFFGDMSDLLSSAQKTALGTMLDSDDNSFIFTNGNTPTGTNKFSAIDGTIEITSNNLKLTNDGTTQAHVALPFTTVVGKSYVAEIKLTTANMSGGLSVSDDLNENTLSVSSSSGAIITSNTLVATGTTSYVHIKNNSTNNNQYNLYDNLKVREVGISSSGFETAVNEPVVPQVPLMRYNQTAIFDGVDDYVSLGGNVSLANDFTIEIWASTLKSGSNDFLGHASDTTFIRTDTGNNRLRIRNTSGSIANLTSLTTPTDGSIFHLVLSRNSGVITAYLNGVKTGNTPTIYGTLNINEIGNVSGNTEYDGLIFSVSIFNSAFTETEAQELFNDGVALDATTHSQSANLIGYWRNDGVTTWKDRSTNSNDGTVSGSPDSITIREGLNTNRDGLGFYFTNPSNNVLRLNGVDEFLEIDDSDVFSFGNSVGDLPFTISAWIKPRGTSALFRIVDKSTSTSVVEYNLSIDSSNKCTLALYDSSTSHLIFRPSSSSIVADQWTFVTATYNGSGANSGINIYINDALNNGTASSSGSYTAMHNTTSTLKIGIRKFDDSFGNGLIDELRIYNKELSLAEIQKNYKHQKGKHKND